MYNQQNRVKIRDLLARELILFSHFLMKSEWITQFKGGLGEEGKGVNLDFIFPSYHTITSI